MKLWRVLLLSLALVVSSAATYIVVAQTQTWAMAIRSQITQLKPVPAEEIPKYGTYWSLQRAGWPPLPYCPFPELPTYHLYGNSYLIDDLSVDYPAWHEQMRKERAVRKAQAEYGLSAVDAEALVTTLGLAAEEFMPEGGMMMASYSYPAGSFYLKILSANATNASLILHGTTNDCYYELLSRESLTNDTWLSEGSLQGADGQDFSPASLSVGNRTNSLFIRARLLTNGPGGTLPLWWQWEHFGATGVPTNGDFDSDGQSNLDEYAAGTDPNTVRFTADLGYQHFNTCSVTGLFEVLGGSPAWAAVLINDTNRANATWTPYNGAAVFNLGATDGTYNVSLALKGRATNSFPVWLTTTVTLDRAAPELRITSPAPGTVSKPVIQVQGCSPESLWAVSYSVSNAVALQTNLTGFLMAGSQPPTNAFELLDVELTNGLNLVTLTVEDLAGNRSTTNLEYTLDYSGVTNPPALQVLWPQDQALLCGTNFTLRGRTDDETALITLEAVGASGQTNVINALVERNGAVWVDDVPLEAGTNVLTLTAVNAAGLSNTTSLAIVQSSVNLTMNDTGDITGGTTLAVSGTVDSTAHKVWVNGVAATIDNGTWSATVPVTAGGMAVFALRAIPLSDNGGNGTAPAGNSADPCNLNPTSPGALDSSSQREKAAFFRLTQGEWEQYELDASIWGYYSWHYFWKWDETNGGYAERTHVDPLPGGETASGLRYWITTNGVENFERWLDSPTNIISTNYVSLSDWFWQGWDIKGPWANGLLEYTEQPSEYSWYEYLWSARDVKVLLQTGGRAGVRRSNLFSFSGWAKERTQLGERDMAKARLSIPGVGVKLGSDGMGYTVLSDNKEYDISLKAPAMYYRFDHYPTKHKLRIAANGWPLAPDRVVPNAKFCVGQKINLASYMTPSIDSQIQQLDVEWFFPGVFVNYIEAWPHDAKKYLIDWSLTWQKDTYAWWVSGGEKHPRCDWTMTFNHGQKAHVATNGRMGMHRPSFGSLNPTPPFFPSISTLWGLMVLSLGDLNQNGAMLYESSIKSDFEGIANITQLVNANRWRDQYIDGGFLRDHFTTDGRYDLDTGEWYDKTPAVVSAGGESWLGAFSDSPCYQAGYSYVTIDDKFQDFVRFRPVGAESIWITIARIEWAWNAVATSTNNWVPPSGSTSGPTLHTDSEFPFWSSLQTGVRW